MDLTLERAQALSALARVVGVVERRHTIPILSNVALNADGEALQVRATDLDMEAVESIPAQIATPGQITLPADKLHDIVRNSEAGAQIALTLGSDDPRVKVKSGRSRFSLPALAADAFPSFITDGLSAPFPMPAKLLADMISRVSWAMDGSDKTTAKGCVYLGTKGDQIHAVATNGKVVALRREPLPEGASLSAILPAKLASQLAKWLGDADGDCLVSSAENLIQVRHAGSTLTAKLFEAPAYFDYARFMEEAHDLTATTDQDALSAALRRVMVVSDDRAGTVRMSFASGALTLMARGDSAGEGAEEITADYEGPDTAILMNGAQVAAALAALKGDRVEFCFAAASDPKIAKTSLVVIRAPVDPAFVSNIAQMRA